MISFAKIQARLFGGFADCLIFAEIKTQLHSTKPVFPTLIYKVCFLAYCWNSKFDSPKIPPKKLACEQVANHHHLTSFKQVLVGVDWNLAVFYLPRWRQVGRDGVRDSLFFPKLRKSKRQ